jgi:hypothetical protein
MVLVVDLCGFVGGLGVPSGGMKGFVGFGIFSWLFCH